MAAEQPELLVAALTVISLLAGSLVLIVKTWAQAKAANQAVNNVGPGDHSLWDQVAFLREDVQQLVESQRDFTKRGWQALPDDIATAARLTETIREIQHSQQECKEAIREIGESVLTLLSAINDQ